MKIFASLLFCLILSVSVAAQTALEGHWKGYILPLEPNNINNQNFYDFDVYIENHKVKGYRAITIAKNKLNYVGKAKASLSLVDSFNSIILSEYKLLQSNYEDEDNSCLMFCKLNFKNNANTFFIKGNYSSSNLKNNFNCGDGRIFLVKVDAKIDFSAIEKDDVLLPFKHSKKKKTNLSSNSYQISISKTTINNISNTQNLQFEFIPCPNSKENVYSTTPSVVKPKAKKSIKYYKIVEYVAPVNSEVDSLD